MIGQWLVNITPYLILVTDEYSHLNSVQFPETTKGFNGFDDISVFTLVAKKQVVVVRQIFVLTSIHTHA